MLDQWMADPSKVGATALLVMAVLAFYKVLIVPRQTHDATIAQLIAAHKDVITKLETDIERERREKDEFKALVFRQLEVTNKALNTAEKAQQMRSSTLGKRSEDKLAEGTTGTS